MTVTLEQQIACVKREIGMRQRVYPRWVESGKMKQDAADREIAAMKAVHETLIALQWQPMKSAPRDGTWLLLYSTDCETGAFIGQWRDDRSMPDGGAWWGDDDAGFPIDADPTGWMLRLQVPPRPAQASLL